MSGTINGLFALGLAPAHAAMAEGRYFQFTVSKFALQHYSLPHVLSRQAETSPSHLLGHGPEQDFVDVSILRLAETSDWFMLHKFG